MKIDLKISALLETNASLTNQVASLATNLDMLQEGGNLMDPVTLEDKINSICSTAEALACLADALR